MIEQIEIQCKYSGYIERQQDEINRQLKYEAEIIPTDMDYNEVASLSAEIQQKLNAQRPQTIGQASRISGMTPAAISLLLVHLKKKKSQKKAV